MTAPPGWPAGVPDPDVDGWQSSAVEWLLELCPADHRAQPLLHRHPVLLARVALEHVRVGLTVMRQGYSRARVDFRDVLDPQQIEQALTFYESEGRRLAAAEKAVVLIEAAMRGKRFSTKL